MINGLTDLSHPCQIVADLLTIIEQGKALPGLELAWLGDGNNVLSSLIEAAGLMASTSARVVRRAMSPTPALSRRRAPRAFASTSSPTRRSVAGADVVVTDTWMSMGQEHAEAKAQAMMPYQVDER